MIESLIMLALVSTLLTLMTNGVHFELAFINDQNSRTANLQKYLTAKNYHIT